MPSFADWLKASWADFRRRWTVVLAVAGVGGGVTLLAGLAPFLPAALLTAFGVGPAWAVWGGASSAGVLAALWLSTWAQAAVTRAALTDDKAGECLSRGWGQTRAFAWVLSLVMVAVVGGYFLFLIPGMILSVALFSAPFYAITGEATGARALSLSWARVRPRLGAVALRMLAAAAIGAAPGWIPYVGWIVMLFWSPFTILALARLDRDVAAAEPVPAEPAWMGRALAGLAAVFVLGAALSVYAGVRTTLSLVRNFNAPGGLASRVRPETAQALLDAFSGQADDDKKKKAYEDLLAELKGEGAR